MIIEIIILSLASLALIALSLWQRHSVQSTLRDVQANQYAFQEKLMQHMGEQWQKALQSEHAIQERLQSYFGEQRQQLDKQQIQHLKTLQESLQTAMQDVRQQVMENLTHNIQLLSKQMQRLTQDTEQKLKEISGQVDKRLAEGFEKTNATFSDIIKRLALIDQAQQKITELSSNVVSLQEVLADKRSRGAFGEVQLNSLIRNVLPEKHFAFQHSLSNGKRVDCMLFLPPPSGNVAIDAKFPLESFRRLSDLDLPESERRLAESQFKQDIKKHIQDIQSKYIIANETSDGAVMFIPAEAIFAEIHAHFPDLVELAQRARVWMASPTTLMAILTTARAVLKDEATRKQVHIIQEHLGMLAKDFMRFQKRMDNLARHMDQAHEDVRDVHVSASKITSRFQKIEQVEMESLESTPLPELIED